MADLPKETSFLLCFPSAHFPSSQLCSPRYDAFHPTFLALPLLPSDRRNWKLGCLVRLAILYRCVYRFSLLLRSATAISDVARACRSKKLTVRPTQSVSQPLQTRKKNSTPKIGSILPLSHYPSKEGILLLVLFSSGIIGCFLGLKIGL